MKYLYYLICVVMVMSIAERSEAAWYSASWLMRQELTIDASITTQDLSQFPLLISVTDQSASLFTYAQTDADDILFTASDGITKLSHQIERYNRTAGQRALVVWVKIPLISATANTTIYLYYGNSACSSQQAAADVWDSSSRSVYHFLETSGNFKDSTSTMNPLVPMNDVGRTASGKIGNAAFFDGSDDYAQSSSNSGISGTQSRTVSLWFNASSWTSDVALVRWGTEQDNSETMIAVGPSHIIVDGYNDQYVQPFTFTLNNWYHVAFTYSSGSITVYVNGSLVGTSSGHAWNTIDAPIIVAPQNGVWQRYAGVIDELRLDTVVRDSAWLSALYNTTSSPEAYFSLAAPVTITATAVTVPEQLRAGQNNCELYFTVTSNGVEGIAKLTIEVPITFKLPEVTTPANTTATLGDGTNLSSYLSRGTFAAGPHGGTVITLSQAGVTATGQTNHVTLNFIEQRAPGSPGSYTWYIQTSPTSGGAFVSILNNPVVTVTGMAGDGAGTTTIATAPTPVVGGTSGNDISIALANNSGESTSTQDIFNNWASYGDGTWVLNGTILQCNNNSGYPTFFISDEVLFDANITFDVRVAETGGDDDFVGWVFRFQNATNFYVFDWKQALQANAPYGTAPVGRALKRIINGDFNGDGTPDPDSRYIWEGRSTYSHVMARDSAAWADNTWYTARIAMRGNTISLYINNMSTPVLQVTDANFSSGRFGPYSFSQPYTQFRNIVIDRLASFIDTVTIEIPNGWTMPNPGVNLTAIRGDSVNLTSLLSVGTVGGGPHGGTVVTLSGANIYGSPPPNTVTFRFNPTSAPLLGGPHTYYMKTAGYNGTLQDIASHPVILVNGTVADGTGTATISAEPTLVSENSVNTYIIPVGTDGVYPLESIKIVVPTGFSQPGYGTVSAVRGDSVDLTANLSFASNTITLSDAGLTPESPANEVTVTFLNIRAAATSGTYTWQVSTAGPSGNLSAISSSPQVFVNPAPTATPTPTATDTFTPAPTRTPTPTALPAADLTIITGDITFNPSQAEFSLDTVTINATIHNDGATNAGSFIVRFYNGNPGSGGTQIGNDHSVTGLSVGASALITGAYAVPCPSADIYVKVDATDQVTEVSEVNNIAHRLLPVQYCVSKFSIASNPTTKQGVMGAPVRFALTLTNSNLGIDTFTLSVAGLTSSWVTLSEETITLNPGEVRNINLDITSPAGCEFAGSYPFSVSALSDQLNATKSVNCTLALSSIPVVNYVSPAQAASLGSNDVLFSWTTSGDASTDLYYRLSGESAYNHVTGASGTSHEVMVTGLLRNQTYQWYGASTDACGTGTGAVRYFTILNGIVFDDKTIALTVPRDYDQQRSIEIQNQDTEPHDLYVTISEDFEELIVEFVGEGSQDTTIRLMPGELYTLDLRINAQDVNRDSIGDPNKIITDTYVRFAGIRLHLVSDEGTAEEITDFATATITVEWPNVDLELEEITADPITLYKTMRLTNHGATLTDIQVRADAVLHDQVMLIPIINHLRLESDAYIEFCVIPKFTADVVLPLTGDIIAAAAGEEFPESITFTAPVGSQMYEVEVGEATICMRVKDWYCTNRPDIRIGFNIPAGFDCIAQSMVVSTFNLPWSETAYKPHDVYWKMNGVTIGSLIDAIPSGSYSFGFDPSLLNLPGETAARNYLGFHTVHLNGGHYVVVADNIIILYLCNLTLHVFAESQEAADSIGVLFPYCDGCNNGNYNLDPKIKSTQLYNASNQVQGIYSAGETVKIKTTVYNPHALESYNVTASLLIDANETAPWTYASHDQSEDWIFAIQPHQELTHEWTWVVPGSPGSQYSVKVTLHETADYDHCYVCPEEWANHVQIGAEIKGFVKNSSTLQPIVSANVYIDNSYYDQDGTDSSGAYVVLVPNGSYTLNASKSGYLAGHQGPIVVNGYDITNVNFLLSVPSPTPTPTLPPTHTPTRTPTPLPDLVIHYEDISFDEIPLEEGDPVVIQARIYNTGLVATGSFSVRFYNGDPGAGGVQLGSDQVVTSLNGGTSTVVSLNTTAICPDALIFVAVDYYQTVTESSESNNRAARALPVVFCSEDLLISIDPETRQVGKGGSTIYTVSVENNNLSSDNVTLSLSGLNETWYELFPNTLSLDSGELGKATVSVTAPDNCASAGTSEFDVTALSTTLNDSVSDSAALIVDSAPVITNLTPENNARLSSNDVVFMWETASWASTRVYYREVGTMTYQTANGDAGPFHFTEVQNLKRDTSFEWYVSSTDDCGASNSETRILTILNGIVFEERSYSLTVDRDYDQRRTVRIINQDTVAHSVIVNITEQFDELIVGFVGEGSSDIEIMLAPGGFVDVDLAIHAQDVTRDAIANPNKVILETGVLFKNILLQLTCDNGTPEEITDHARVDITVEWPNINFTLAELSNDPITMVKTIRVTNLGDTLTDLAITADDTVKGLVLFLPVINHFRLETNETIDFCVIPTFNNTVVLPLTGDIIGTAGDVAVEESVTFECTTGTSLYDVTIHDSEICMDIRDWYCTNRPTINLGFNIPSAFPCIESALAVFHFDLPWAQNTYKPHNVYLSINGHEFGTLLDVIPSGDYAFIIPVQYLRVPVSGAGANTITIRTTHPNHGHYVVSATVRVILTLCELNLTVCGMSQENAETVAAGFPYCTDCGGTYDLGPRIISITPLNAFYQPQAYFQENESMKVRVVIVNTHPRNIYDLRNTLIIDNDGVTPYDYNSHNYYADVDITLTPMEQETFYFTYTVPNPAQNSYLIAVELHSQEVYSVGCYNCPTTFQVSYLVGGTISGTVYDALTNHPIANAQVACGTRYYDPDGTNESGYFTFDAPNGSYTLSATASGYSPGSIDPLLVEGANITDLTIYLNIAPTATPTITPTPTATPLPESIPASTPLGFVIMLTCFGILLFRKKAHKG